MKSHILEKKSSKRKRSFRKDRPVAASDVKGVKRLTITVEAADPTAERVDLADARVQK